MTNTMLMLLAIGLLVGCRAQSPSGGENEIAPEALAETASAGTPVPPMVGMYDGGEGAAQPSVTPTPSATPVEEVSASQPPQPAPASTEVVQAYSAATPEPEISAPAAKPYVPPVQQPSPEPVRVQAGTSLQQAAIAAGWPAHLAAWVERTALCESSGRTTAVSPAGYRGLMQVAPWLHGPVPADAVGQLAQAYEVYQKQGAGAWPVCGS